MVHKHTQSTGQTHATPFHEVPYTMASTPSNYLLYITTSDSEKPANEGRPGSPRNIIHSARQASHRRLISQGHKETDNQVSLAVHSETITMIDAVAKTLCGDNTPPNTGENFNVYHSRRRGSLPPIYINQKTTHSLKAMPEMESDEEENQSHNPLFTKRTQLGLPQGFNPGRRNSLMVPLPASLDSSPLIPPCSRERSHSLSPNHRSLRLSPLHNLEPYQNETIQPTPVPVRNLRRKSIANVLSTSPEKYERSESSLDLV